MPRILLHDEYLNRFDKEYKNLLADRNSKQNRLNQLRNNKLTSMVMADNPPDKMRNTYMLVRGQYSSPDKSKVIQPNTPSFLPAMKDGNNKNRLGLAKWLTDKENPLTPRVTVNRYWQTIFGRGISDTPSDFGSQGKWPSHPDLLNWLAADFIESDWDVKRAIRQLVTSATYRQSSVTTEEHMAKDPQNLYFATGSTFPNHGRICARPSLACQRIAQQEIWRPRREALPTRRAMERSIPGPQPQVCTGCGNKIYRRSMYTSPEAFRPSARLWQPLIHPPAKSVPFSAGAPIHQCNRWSPLMMCSLWKPPASLHSVSCLPGPRISQGR